MIRIGIVGAGPAGLLMFKRLCELPIQNLRIEIFEKSNILGSGMPYSGAGALIEHVTNVSGDELPKLRVSLEEWVKRQPDQVLAEFAISKDDFHEKEVVPRLLFGRYLSHLFEEQIEAAKRKKISVSIHTGTEITDLIDHPETAVVTAMSDSGKQYDLEHIVICTGHKWTTKHEGRVAGYFDSPYPPKKLQKPFNHKVVVRGSSLTAIDAIKTIASSSGRFFWEDDRYRFERSEDCPDFSIEIHSRDGLLPSLRIHMEEPHVDSNSLIEQSLLDKNMQENQGFLELDFVFKEGFIEPLKELSINSFDEFKDMTIEQFVDKMLSYRLNAPAFELLKREYRESLKSIEREKSIPWKETLGALSFAMNYPAKHFSAEDMLRLRSLLLPLISVVIAFMPQSSCETLLALHDAGCLTLVADGKNGEVTVDDAGKIHYKTEEGDEVCETFIDCIGQKHFDFEDFPFKSLVKQNVVTGAFIAFRSDAAAEKVKAEGEQTVVQKSDRFYLKVPGVAVDDNFAVLNEKNESSERLYLMAVPHIGGFNPDYSGLDFCEQASKRIARAITGTHSHTAVSLL